MTMLADVKTALRVTTDDLDSDITILINAAVADLKLQQQSCHKHYMTCKA